MYFASYAVCSVLDQSAVYKTCYKLLKWLHLNLAEKGNPLQKDTWECARLIGHL